MSNRKNSKYKTEIDKYNNNIENLGKNTSNKKYMSLNNFSVFNRMDKIQEEFSLENKDSNNNHAIKRIFNQIRLTNSKSKDHLYSNSNTNREIKIKTNNKAVKDMIFQINHFMNEDADLLFKNNNCLNLKQLILRNIDKMKFEINKNKVKMPNGISDNLDKEDVLNSEDRYLMTNEHIINNCASVNYKNTTLKTNNLKHAQEEPGNYGEDRADVINHDNIAIEENKNCLNSKNREDYKNLLFNDNIKLKKNISAVLKKQEDLYKYLESNFCPMISKNFEKEKNRVNNIVVFSANPSKRTRINKTQNSSIDKNAVNKQEKNYRANLDLEIRNIQEHNQLIPRKFKTANILNKRDTNPINAFKTDSEKITKNLQNEYERGCIPKTKKVDVYENKDKHLFFMTNVSNSNMNNKPKEERQITIKRSIFTPDVNQRTSNLLNNESNLYQKFPARAILKLKSDDKIIKKNKSFNLKNSDVYYKNKKKIRVFESVKDDKNPLPNKNLSRNIEFNSIGTNYELNVQDTEKDVLVNEDLNSFKGENEKTYSKENSEYSDIKGKEDRENSFIDVIVSKTNSNKKNSNNNEINKQDYINILVGTKLELNNDIYNKEANKNNINYREHFDRKGVELDPLPKKSENKEDNFDPIEKELNFSRISSENKDELVKEEQVETRRSSRNLLNYQSKSNFDKNEAFILKENLIFNTINKDKSNENGQKHKYSKSRPNLLNRNIPRIEANKSASNFFSKNKIFSYLKDDKFKNIQDNGSKENLRFTESLKVKKVRFVFDKASSKQKIPDIFQNKVINKTTVVFKNKK